MKKRRSLIVLTAVNVLILVMSIYCLIRTTQNSKFINSFNSEFDYEEYENGKVIYSVNVLLYNLDTEMYGKAGSFYICYADRPEISAAHYTVPSEYVETIVDYMKEIALENFKGTTHVVS